MGIPIAISSGRDDERETHSQPERLPVHFSNLLRLAQSIASLRQAEAVSGQQGSGFGAAHKVQELAGGILLFRFRQHDRRLVQRGIGIERNRPVPAFALSTRAQAHAKARSVQPEHCPIRQIAPPAKRFLRARGGLKPDRRSRSVECRFGCASVGSSCGIRNRNLLDRRIEQSLDAEL